MVHAAHILDLARLTPYSILTANQPASTSCARARVCVCVTVGNGQFREQPPQGGSAIFFFLVKWFSRSPFISIFPLLLARLDLLHDAHPRSPEREVSLFSSNHPNPRIIPP